MLFNRTHKIQLIGAIIAIAWTVLLFIVGSGMGETIGLTAQQPVDWHKYVAMAESPTLSFRISPFCYRIFVPTVAGVLPLPTQMSFLLIQVISVILVGAFTALAVWRNTQSTVLSIICVLWVLSLGWVTKANLDVAPSVDLAAWSLLVVLYISRSAHQFGLSLVCSVLAVLTKESALVGVFAVLFLAEASERWTIQKSVAVLMLPVSVMLCLWVLFPSLNSDAAYLDQLNPILSVINGVDSNDSVFANLLAIGVPRLTSFNLENIVAITTDSWGLPTLVGCIVLCIVSIKKATRLLVVMVLSSFQAFLATNIQRPILIVAPILIIALARELNAFAYIRWGLHWVGTSGAVLGLITIFVSRYSPSTAMQLGVLLIAGLVVYLHRRYSHQQQIGVPL